MGERSITGLDLIRDTSENVGLIRKRLLMAQSWQKSYANRWRRPLEFKVGDHVFLKVMPKRRVVRFDKQGKLSPRYIGPFEILERVGTVAYRLALPPSLSGVHEVFHVSMLRKYTPDYSGETGWPNPFRLRSKMGWASFAHIFLGQILTNPSRPDAGCRLKRAKTGQN